MDDFNTPDSADTPKFDPLPFDPAPFETIAVSPGFAELPPAPPGCALRDRGQVALDSALLRQLRRDRLLSQQELADDCWRRNIRVSIATIKRAESGRAVRFRIAHELARCFGIPVMRIVRAAPPAG